MISEQFHPGAGATCLRPDIPESPTAQALHVLHAVDALSRGGAAEPLVDDTRAFTADFLRLAIDQSMSSITSQFGETPSVLTVPGEFSVSNHEVVVRALRLYGDSDTDDEVQSQTMAADAARDETIMQNLWYPACPGSAVPRYQTYVTDTDKRVAKLMREDIDVIIAALERRGGE